MVSRVTYNLSALLCLTVAGVAWCAVAQAQGLLSGEEALKKQFVGNTIQFSSFRTGTPVLVYFAEDGQLLTYFQNINGDGKWWIDGGETLCRKTPDLPQECARVEAAQDMVTFHVAGRKPYSAQLIVGKKVP